MRNHSEDRRKIWVNSNNKFIPVRFLTNKEINHLLHNYIINDKFYLNIKGSEWKEILQNELDFRNQETDELLYKLLLKNTYKDNSTKKDIIYLINPDLTPKDVTKSLEALKVISEKLLVKNKKATIAEPNEA